ALLVNFNAYHFVPLAYVIAVRVLLPIDRFAAFVRYVLNGIVVAVLGLSVATALDYSWYWLLASTWLVLFTQVVVLVLYAGSMVRKYPIDWYYSIPLLMGLVSYFFWQMSLLGILNAPWVFKTSTFLFISEIFIFGLFLGKIIRNYERAKTVSQQQLAFSEAQAAHLREVDALKTNFFANISHEFRTPLTLLMGPLADLRSRYPQERMVPVMQRNVRRLQALINQFLDLARIESGKLKPDLVRGDIAKFMRPLFASFESLAQSRSILFHYQQNEEEKEAVFDPDKLEKIITNLLSNAFKFTPENGRVDVWIVYSANDMVIRVKDNGIGIQQEHLPHVFDRFYQAETTVLTGEEGSGIGLSLVRELVELLRGSIRVESQPDQGSTFTVQLPIDAASWAGIADISELSGNEPTSPVTIESTLPEYHETTQTPSDRDAPVLLLVEDNADLRAYIRSIFDASYQVVEATDGQDGLAKAFAHIPDLVICDVMMPRLNGFDFCKTLKSDALTSHIPIIILSAKATLDDRLEGLGLGANDYLSKPFARAELELRVQNQLRQRDVLQQKYSEQLAIPSEKIPPADSLDEKFLNRAIRVVEEYCDDSDFGITGLCEALNVSRSNLHRKLKALTNQSTTEFIRSIRIYRAADLLKDPTLSVSEVAYRVGFQSVSYFSKSFSEQMGTSPTEWVKSHAR
ncbi:MAG: response regulator, partial [Bacteroidetes bacterium]|nr:response regulator [Bacteroidota bacterium]